MLRLGHVFHHIDGGDLHRFQPFTFLSQFIFAYPGLKQFFRKLAPQLRFRLGRVFEFFEYLFGFNELLYHKLGCDLRGPAGYPHLFPQQFVLLNGCSNFFFVEDHFQIFRLVLNSTYYR